VLTYEAVNLGISAVTPKLSPVVVSILLTGHVPVTQIPL
jgi:hypothetical protein